MGRQEAIKDLQRNRLRGRLNSVRSRLDQSYMDKLDGKISEDFGHARATNWARNHRRTAISVVTANCEPRLRCEYVEKWCARQDSNQLINSNRNPLRPVLYLNRPAP